MIILQVAKSTASVERMVQYIQSRTIQLEIGELDQLFKNAQDEAIRLALALAAQPAPTFPGVPLKKESAELENFQFDDLTFEDKKDKFTDDRFGYGAENEEYMRLAKGRGNSSQQANGWVDDFVGFRDDKDGSALTTSNQVHLSDIESTKLCNEWKGNYSVVPGVSWGDLPFDLQQKWLHYSCDYHLTETGSPIFTPDKDDAIDNNKDPVNGPTIPLDAL